MVGWAIHSMDHRDPRNRQDYQSKKNIQQISIRTVADFHDLIDETVHQEWQDLDRLLVELWTSRSIIPAIYARVERGNHLSELAESLLPELASRGAINAVEER